MFGILIDDYILLAIGKNLQKTGAVRNVRVVVIKLVSVQLVRAITVSQVPTKARDSTCAHFVRAQVSSQELCITLISERGCSDDTTGDDLVR